MTSDPSQVGDARDAHVRDMDPTTLYAVLALRVDVFVVEQECPYRELDGRDLEPDARMVWIEREGAVLATLRVLREAGGAARIGRVATAADARGAGLAAALMQHAIELTAGLVVELHAQSHLESWYERFGFSRCGPDYLEDGIPHTPMRRAPGSNGCR